MERVVPDAITTSTGTRAIFSISTLPTLAAQAEGSEIVTVHPRGRFKADNGTALISAAVAGLGIAWLPDGLTNEHVASGALVPVMTRYPPPPAGIYVIRPPGRHPARKVRVLTDMLIECFEPFPRLPDAGR